MSANVPGILGKLSVPASEYWSDNLEKWLRGRRVGLGASETAAVLRLNKWSTPLEIWMEKVSTERPEQKDIGPKAKWGLILEDVVARQASKEFLSKMGLKIAPSPGLLVHPDHPWMIATVDRLIVPRGVKTPEPVAVLEIKTTGSWNYRQRWIDGIPPADIQIQVQQQLAVTGLPYAYVACLVDGSDFKEPVRIDRDDHVIEQIIIYAGGWWEKYVVGRVQPEPTFDNFDHLSDIYPGDDSLPSVAMNDDDETALGLFLHHREQEKHHKQQKELAQFELQKRLGDALTMKDAHGAVALTWKPTTTNRIDVKALRADEPRIADQYTKTMASRRFFVKDTAP